LPDKEASARIKINKLLEAAGWRFFPEEGAPANIRDNMESVEKLLYELYQQEITHGVIKVGKDNYLSFSPVIE